MISRLRATFAGKPGHYDRLEEFESDIALMAHSLAAHGGAHMRRAHGRRRDRAVRPRGRPSVLDVDSESPPPP